MVTTRAGSTAQSSQSEKSKGTQTSKKESAQKQAKVAGKPKEKRGLCPAPISISKLMRSAAESRVSSDKVESKSKDVTKRAVTSEKERPQKMTEKQAQRDKAGDSETPIKAKRKSHGPQPGSENPPKKAKSNDATKTTRTRPDEKEEGDDGVTQSKTEPSSSHEPSRQGQEDKPYTGSNVKLRNLIEKFGAFPLSDVGLASPQEPTSETILAHLLNALLSSGRISHKIAAKTLRCLVQAGYHDVRTLKASSWERRTEILTEGGYTHYREKMATQLGDLAEWITEKYGMYELRPQ